MSMTGGEAVVEALLANDVSAVFGIPGMHNLPIYDALYQRQKRIRHILARHEHGAGLMANGYARASGHPGVVLTTTGPAACNVLTGLGDAYRDSVPVLAISSQVRSDLIGTDRNAFHGMHDQLGMAAGVVGWARRIERVEEIPTAMAEAWRAMLGERPQPVYIEVPHDVLSASGAVSPLPADLPTPTPAAQRVITQAAERLRDARRVLVYAGGGATSSSAGPALLEFAERLGAPVATTCNGKGIVPEDHPLALGFVRFASPPFASVWRRADLVVAVGTDFDEVMTHDWQLAQPQSLIRIDVDPARCAANYRPTVALNGDAAETLRCLVPLLPDSPHPEQGAFTAQARRAVMRCRDQAATQDGYEVVTALREWLGSDGVLVGDAARVGIWQLRFDRTNEPRTSPLPLGFGTLGFGLPAAIGAKAARPDARVACLCGDGGLLFSIGELATAVQHQLNVVTVVVNDNAFGSIRHLQQSYYGGRVIGADLINPDFVALANAFGAFGTRVQTPRQLPAALAEAAEAARPALIEVPGPIAPPSTA